MKRILKIIDSEISKLEKVKMNLLKEKIKGAKRIKIGISSSGKGLNSHIYSRFGRCPNFVIIELDNKKKIKETKDMKNTAKGKISSAGIISAQLIANQGVKAVLAGNIGPRAFAIFRKLGIKTYQASGTVGEAAENFANGRLKRIEKATGQRSVVFSKSTIRHQRTFGFGVKAG